MLRSGRLDHYLGSGHSDTVSLHLPNTALIDDLAAMREHTPPICAVLQTARLIRTLSQLVVRTAAQSGGQLFMYMASI